MTLFDNEHRREHVEHEAPWLACEIAGIVTSLGVVFGGAWVVMKMIRRILRMFS